MRSKLRCRRFIGQADVGRFHEPRPLRVTDFRTRNQSCPDLIRWSMDFHAGRASDPAGQGRRRPQTVGGAAGLQIRLRTPLRVVPESGAGLVSRYSPGGRCQLLVLAFAFYTRPGKSSVLRTSFGEVPWGQGQRAVCDGCGGQRGCRRSVPPRISAHGASNMRSSRTGGLHRCRLVTASRVPCRDAGLVLFRRTALLCAWFRT